MAMPTAEQTYGAELARRRADARMSKSKLATLTGLDRRTIRNVEEGKTEPAPETVQRIDKALPRPAQAAATTERPVYPADAHLTPTYDPMRYADQMAVTFRGRGGAIDQAWLYLDAQSVRDWLRYCGDAGYMANYRDRVPLAEIADRVAESASGYGVDVVALGPGDGHTEIRLVSHLLRACNGVVHLDLIDLSHPLLITAFRAATDTLARHGVRVHPIHGDFYGLAGHEYLAYRSPTDNRRRLWTLFGNTVGNLRDEPIFFRDLAQLSRPGDLAVLDFQVAPAAADDEAAIQEKDGLLRGIPPLVATWITGPLRRHLPEAQDIELRPWLNTNCPVRGSYAVMASARVRRGDPATIAEYHLARFKRYEPRGLVEALAGVGWRAIGDFRYGPNPPACGVLLAERTE